MHIRTLTLSTASLIAQRDFYTRVLECPVLEETSQRLALQVGTSQLIFVEDTLPVPPVYHFAVNIPENQFGEAKIWLQQRVPLLTDSQGADEFYSQGWNAHMVYFYDAAGNIGELIARHTRPVSETAPFSAHSLLNISEIGIAADDVQTLVKTLHERASLMPYRGPGSDTFTALGDEEGLFIVVKTGRVWFPETGKPAEHVPIAVEINSEHGPMMWEFS